MKKLFAFILAALMVATVLTTTSGCPGKDTKSTTSTPAGTSTGTASPTK